MRKQRINKNEGKETFSNLAKAWDTSYTSVFLLEKTATRKLKPVFEVESADRMEVCQMIVEELQSDAAYEKAILETIAEEYNVELPKSRNFKTALRELFTAANNKMKFEQMELI